MTVTPEQVYKGIITYMIPLMKKKKVTVEQVREKIPPKEFVKFLERIYGEGNNDS